MMRDTERLRRQQRRIAGGGEVTHAWKEGEQVAIGVGRLATCNRQTKGGAPVHNGDLASTRANRNTSVICRKNAHHCLQDNESGTCLVCPAIVGG